MKKLPYILFLVALTVAIAAGARSHRSAATDSRAASDYMYLEALRAKSQEKHDVAFELLHRAHELNPADRTIGAELSLYKLILSSDSDNVAQSMNLLQDYCIENPEDVYYNTRYGVLCEELSRNDEAINVWRSIHALNPDRPEFAYHLAELLAKIGGAGNLSDALAVYDSLEITEGLSIPLSSRKINIYHEQGDTAAIIAEVDRVRTASPRSVEAQVFSGDIFTMLNLTDRAKEFYDSACIIDPSSGLAKYSRARYYNHIGDSAAFIGEIFDALAERDLDLETKLSMLKGYIQETFVDSVRNPKVESLFDRLIEMHPHEHEVHYLYGSYLIAHHRYATAARQIEQALDADPSDKTQWELLTSLYMQTMELDRAEEAILRSLRYFPDNPRMYLMLGVIMMENEEYEKALKEYNNALSYADTTDTDLMSQLYQTIGDTYYKMKDSGKAFEYYAKSLEQNPDNSLALNNYAYYLAEEGRDLEEAKKSILKVLLEEPENVNALDTYAWVLFKMKDYIKAREIIDETLNLMDEPNAEVLEHAGDIYFMDSEPEKALEFWKRASFLDPGNELLRKKVTYKTYFYK